jgi:hypothetical protein
MSSITVLSFLGQNDSAKVKKYREAEQLAQNKRVFDIIEAHWKTLKSIIKGLGKITSMDCIVKISANVCCIVTALFDIQPGNPFPVLYLTCIKMIEFIKHLHFIHWYADIKENVLQLPYISLNMLQHILSQLASFSTNSVNNNLIKHGDDGSNLVTTSIQKIVKYLARFFDCMDNHILEGSYPNTIPKFTLQDANPKYKNGSLKFASMIATIESRALAISNKSKPNASPPGTLLTTGRLRSRSSSLQLGQRTSPRLVFSTVLMELQRPICFLPAFLSQCVVISDSTAKNIQSLTRHANSITSRNGINFLLKTRQRFWLIAICLTERKSGLMRIHLQSTGRATIPDKFFIS